MTAPKKSSQPKLLPKDGEKQRSADLQTFEELPDNTQEQLLLSDEAEKATGKHRTKVEKKFMQPA
jgi:hypothetical protein